MFDYDDRLRNALNRESIEKGADVHTRRKFLASMAGATLAAPLTQSCGAVAAAPNRKMRVGAMCVGAGGKLI